ncbi:MAG: helix-turn-helix domain-containing protein [Nitrosospira sp.]
MGPRLIQLRRRYKLSQTKLGELCGVSKAAVSQWETGVSTPEIRKLVELRSKLAFSFDWLLTGQEGTIDSRSDGMPQVERRWAERRWDYRRETCRRKKYRRQSDKPSNPV